MICGVLICVTSNYEHTVLYIIKRYCVDVGHEQGERAVHHH